MAREKKKRRKKKGKGTAEVDSSLLVPMTRSDGKEEPLFVSFWTLDEFEAADGPFGEFQDVLGKLIAGLTSLSDNLGRQTRDVDSVDYDTESAGRFLGQIRVTFAQAEIAHELIKMCTMSRHIITKMSEISFTLFGSQDGETLSFEDLLKKIQKAGEIVNEEFWFAFCKGLETNISDYDLQIQTLNEKIKDAELRKLNPRGWLPKTKARNAAAAAEESEELQRKRDAINERAVEEQAQLAVTRDFLELFKNMAFRLMSGFLVQATTVVAGFLQEAPELESAFNEVVMKAQNPEIQNSLNTLHQLESELRELLEQYEQLQAMVKKFQIEPLKYKEKLDDLIVKVKDFGRNAICTTIDAALISLQKQINEVTAERDQQQQILMAQTAQMLFQLEQANNITRLQSASVKTIRSALQLVTLGFRVPGYLATLATTKLEAAQDLLHLRILDIERQEEERIAAVRRDVLTEQAKAIGGDATA